jgi:intermediate cleaving peptidase 55
MRIVGPLASKLPDRGIAVIAASDIKYRSGAVFYDFHQDSNFFYLTGLLPETRPYF